LPGRSIGEKLRDVPETLLLLFLDSLQSLPVAPAKPALRSDGALWWAKGLGFSQARNQFRLKTLKDFFPSLLAGA
jgi:hypothetical protein